MVGMDRGQVQDMLRDGRIHLLTTDSDHGEEATQTVLRAAVEDGIQVIYVNFARPYTFLVDMLSDTGIDMGGVLFIDPVSQTVQTDVAEHGNVVYVDSPGHLTDIDIAVSTALDEHTGEAVVVLDAVSELEVHATVDDAAQFLHHVTTELRSSKVSGILLQDETGSSDLQSTLRKNADDHINIGSGDEELAFS